MKRILIGVAALVLCAGLGLVLHHGLPRLFHPADGSPGPATEPNEPPPHYPLAAPPPRLRLLEWNFGTSPPRKEMSHRFEITNATAEPWMLKHVTSHCSCTMGELPAKTVRPGETTWLTVTYRAPPQDGKVTGHVMVEFAEPAGPIFQISISGEVRALLAAEPASLVFDYPPAGTRPSQTVKLRSRADRAVALTRVEAPDWLRAEWRPADELGPDGQPRQAWELVVKADPDKLRTAPGPATLAVHTDADEGGPALIPVRAKAALEAAPGQLAFDAVESGKTALLKVSLAAAPALGELTEKDLVATHDLGDELDVQVRKGESAHQFILLVRFQPKHSLGLVEGELEVKTRAGTAPPVRVKVTGTAARAR